MRVVQLEKVVELTFAVARSAGVRRGDGGKSFDGSKVRLASALLHQRLWRGLGVAYSALIPYAMQGLSELLSDSSEDVETTTAELVREFEAATGQTIEKNLRF